MQTKSVPVPPRSAPKHRTRSQFKAFLIYRLRLAGASLPDRPSYAELANACDNLLPRDAR